MRVLDVDLASLPERIDCAGYGEAFVLVRRGGRPVGSVTLPVRGGVIPSAELRERLAGSADHALGDALLEEFLGDDPLPPLPSATIAVCTHERPDDLANCIEALLALPAGAHEILIVDSGPRTDATRDLVARHAGLRYLREERPGLDRARNRAIREASGDIVAFTDDDAIVDPGWLEALRANFRDRLVMAVTGLTMPAELETQAQIEHERFSTFSRGFRRLVFEATSRSPGAAGNPGAGVNMAIRRSALDRIGPFDDALDAGTPTHSGGDAEYFSRILSRGYRIVYEPRALSFHRHRRTRRELRRAFYGYGVGVYAAFTRSLLFEGEWSVVQHAAAWLLKYQLPDLVRGLAGRPGVPPPDLTAVQLAGCAVGPWAYFRSRRRNGGPA
jgi:GT2 family glycosyltransferase